MINIHSIRDLKTTAHPGAHSPKTKGLSADDFQTERYAIDVLAPYIMPFAHVWEPACGQGKMVKALRSEGWRVTGTDIKTGVNFLDQVPLNGGPLDHDVIVTNPPYSLKDEFIQRCFETAKPFALLLPLSALGEQGRTALYREYAGIDLIIPARRVQFTTPSGKEGGAWFFTAWFTRGLVQGGAEETGRGRIVFSPLL